MRSPEKGVHLRDEPFDWFEARWQVKFRTKESWPVTMIDRKDASSSLDWNQRKPKALSSFNLTRRDLGPVEGVNSTSESPVELSLGQDERTDKGPASVIHLSLPPSSCNSTRLSTAIPFKEGNVVQLENLQRLEEPSKSFSATQLRTAGWG
jgi:hypothetical protein